MSIADTSKSANCLAMSDVLNRIGDKWSVMVVGILGKSGTLRFNELKRMINGISQRMLTLTLRNLERDGLLSRTVYPTVPPKVEYELTDIAQELNESLATLTAWAERHRATIARARKAYDEAKAQ